MLFLVQLYTVPPVPPLEIIELIAVPEQIVCNAGLDVITVAVGFTTTVAVMAAPAQPFAVGVMVNVTVTGTVLVLVKAPVMLPVPLAAIPVTESVLFLVQLKVVPLILLVSAMGVIVDAEQIVCVVGVAVAFTLGFTNTVAVTGVPWQVAAVGVMVYVTKTGAVVLFTNVPRGLPVPLAGLLPPIKVLSLVHV